MVLLLRRINVPQEEIAELSGLVQEEELGKMFEGYSGYDVQETRRAARGGGWPRDGSRPQKI
jgi:hypothetical protein